MPINNLRTVDAVHAIAEGYSQTYSSMVDKILSHFGEMNNGEFVKNANSQFGNPIRLGFSKSEVFKEDGQPDMEGHYVYEKYDNSGRSLHQIYGKGGGTFHEIKIDGTPMTFIRKGNTQEFRDIGTGYTYIITSDEHKGPFKYGVFYIGSLSQNLNGKTYAIPYLEDGSIDPEGAYVLGGDNIEESNSRS